MNYLLAASSLTAICAVGGWALAIRSALRANAERLKAEARAGALIVSLARTEEACIEAEKVLTRVRGKYLGAKSAAEAQTRRADVTQERLETALERIRKGAEALYADGIPAAYIEELFDRDPRPAMPASGGMEQLEAEAYAAVGLTCEGVRKERPRFVESAAPEAEPLEQVKRAREENNLLTLQLYHIRKAIYALPNGEALARAIPYCGDEPHA